jgi:hypothetical protein
VHIRNRILPEKNLFPVTGFTTILVQNNMKGFVIKDKGLGEYEGFTKKPNASVLYVYFFL